ncbi:MAG: hypothetical protein GQ540_08040 [Lutibacter sp.]|uniref:hypothetical protein n=1 Tax=Lutibacter sp. TaxID=1925666 RepID=UPI0019E5EAEA|nr:hypothetical protein [Lutibacter sp.]NOR28462.1 hypothetical protein [Lutibacter sp.]
MNTFKALFLLLISSSCHVYSQQSNQIAETLKVDKSIMVNFPKPMEILPYDIKIEIETTENSTNYLVISLELKNGSYFISPNSKRAFKGKFYMDLGSYEDIDFEGKLLETPLSVEEVDLHPFVNGTVNWVRVNTTYKQALRIKSKDDFEVFGRIQFTIEPRCTLEEIPFAISVQNGVMKIIENPKC